MLVPAHRDAVFRDAAEARHHAILERLAQARAVADGRESDARTRRHDTRLFRGQRLDLEPVDTNDDMAFVEQVVRERKSRGTHADDEHALARRLARHGAAEVQRIPSREEPVDLESPW